MSLKIVVLAKQVPDTRNVGKDAMNADGTINRAALPAIFNPERPERLGTGTQTERHTSRLYGNYPDHGPRTRCRNYS